jgi:3-methyl-2-oxobutanoate hydroxymethyltransferase
LKKKHTINSLALSKQNGEKLTMITAYDSLFAKIFDREESQIDLILVGDSLNMSFNGKNDTLSIGVDEMVYHTKAVCNGAKNTFIIADMPFGSYTNKEEAFKNAYRFYAETSADAVKIEGGIEKQEIIKHLTENGIAVIGHIGLMPQSFRSEGGYFVKGKDKDSEQKLLTDAKAVQDAGAFALVIEGVKDDVAQKITESLKIPTIGIGAGKNTDGQVLVWSDMLGFFDEFKPKFVKKYLNGAELIQKSVAEYSQDVKNKKFPFEENIY